MTTARFEINNDMNLDGNVETYELSCIVDTDNKTFYFVVDSIANVESFVERLNELNEENKELKKRLSHAEKVNISLIEENHRLRLTLIHSRDLNFDINWLKENLKDWNNYD